MILPMTPSATAGRSFMNHLTISQRDLLRLKVFVPIRPPRGDLVRMSYPSQFTSLSNHTLAASSGICRESESTCTHPYNQASFFIKLSLDSHYPDYVMRLYHNFDARSSPDELQLLCLVFCQNEDLDLCSAHEAGIKWIILLK